MIRIADMTKSFEDRIIFKNFNLNIESGEFAVISGKSGSGKTTLLNIIGGIEKIDCGSVIVDEYNLTKMKSKVKYYQNKIGFLFQNFCLIEEKSVMENMKIVKARNEIISMEEALTSVGLKGYEKTKVYKLSGGEQQRLALARLMIKKCDIILADEPTGSLDSKNAEEVINLLKRINSYNKTVLIVTHDEKIKKSGERLIEI